MNGQPEKNCGVCAYLVAIVGAFLIVAGLVWAMRHYTRPAELGIERAAVRAKALADMRAEEAQAVITPAWIDQPKGVARMPVTEAMKWVEQQWGKDPAAARSNLIARVEKATALPPKAPEKPSPFE